MFNKNLSIRTEGDRSWIKFAPHLTSLPTTLLLSTLFVRDIPASTSSHLRTPHTPAFVICGAAAYAAHPRSHCL